MISDACLKRYGLSKSGHSVGGLNSFFLCIRKNGHSQIVMSSAGNSLAHWFFPIDAYGQCGPSLPTGNCESFRSPIWGLMLQVASSVRLGLC